MRIRSLPNKIEDFNAFNRMIQKTRAFKMPGSFEFVKSIRFYAMRNAMLKKAILFPSLLIEVVYYFRVRA